MGIGQTQISFDESGSNISIVPMRMRQIGVTLITRFLKDDTLPESARWFANPARNDDSSDSPRAGGFTFIDIVIAISVAGIMTVVGLPSYRSFVAKSHYINKNRDLTTLQVNVENFYDANNRYRSAGSFSFTGRSAIDYQYAPSPIGVAHATDQVFAAHRIESSADKVFGTVSSQQLRCACVDSALVNLLGASASPTGASCPAGADS